MSHRDYAARIQYRTNLALLLVVVVVVAGIAAGALASMHGMHDVCSTLDTTAADCSQVTP